MILCRYVSEIIKTISRKENALQFLFLLVSLESDTGGSIRGYSDVSIPIFPNLVIPFDVRMEDNQLTQVLSTLLVLFKRS